MNRTAYTATVVSRPALLVGTVAGLAAGVTVDRVGAGWWAAAVSFLVVGVASLPLATVRVAVGADRVVLGWAAPPLRARVIARATIREAWVEHLRWPQVFGLGLRPERRTTRLTVRAGPTLCLRLTDGELVRVSVPDPRAAAVLAADVPTRRTS